MNVLEEIPMSNKTQEVNVAIRAATAAAKIIMEIYHNNETIIKTKEDGSPVTKADLASNDVIKKILLEESEHPILSEEDVQEADRITNGTVWIIDPLDGTSDFIDKTGEFTVMVSLVRNRKPVLGVIAWPVKGVIFVAQTGQGAFKYSDYKWTKMNVSKITKIPECRMIGSRHHLSDKEKEFVDSLGIANFASIGSSLKVCMIGMGEAEAYITTTNKMKEWDTAASYCIITEAGGKMTDLSGARLTYNNKDVYHKNGILVTNGKQIHNEILNRFRESNP